MDKEALTLNGTEATKVCSPQRLQCSQRHQRSNYVGQLEHTVYDPAGLAKFDEMVQRGELEVVYENEMVKIYQVRGQV